MKLFIHNQYQDPVEIEIAASAKVLDLKKIIATKINGLIAADLVLKFRTQTLNSDSATIQASGIQANSVVELTTLKSFNIFIKTEDNRIHELNVHFTNTAELIKKMLNRLLKIAVDEQRLLFNGSELKNGDILTEKNIIPGTTVNLMLIKLNLQLNIVQRSGQAERIVMPKNSTITQLKQLILAKYKVPPGYQILTYKGQALDNNDKTLADYNIEDLSEIHFRPNDIEIFIQCTTIGRDRITLRALPIDTIGQVKDKIEAQFKINKNAQKLIWNGQVLVDDAILSYEKIYGGSTLNLVVTVQSLKLKIQIGPEDKIQVDVQSTETVAQLKAKLLDKTKIPINQQILFVDNTKLEDGKMLMDYGLNENSDIALERKDSFEVLIESFTGRQITIRVHKDDRVSNIKEQIDRRLGISPDAQRLLYCAQELADDTLEAYQIDKRCTIHLVSRVNGGTI
jgi:ubiquitin C